MDKENRDTQILKKIIGEIDFLINYTAKETYESLTANEGKKRGVAMTFINIGELANKLSDDFQKSATDIPIKSIIAFRNKIAHGYHAIDFEFIWLTITKSIAELKSKIEQKLKIPL